MSREDQIKAAGAKLRLRIPGLKKGLGAGDAVHALTERLGLEHCSECERRKQRLNMLLRFEAALEDEDE